MKYCSHRSQCEMKFAHIREANISHAVGVFHISQKYFTCPQGQISLKKAPAFASAFFWLGYRDSNPNIQSQSLLCYRYTISQCCLFSRTRYIISRRIAFVNRFFEKNQNFLGKLSFSKIVHVCGVEDLDMGLLCLVQNSVIGVAR